MIEPRMRVVDIYIPNPSMALETTEADMEPVAGL